MSQTTKMRLFISMLSDYGFKKTFGNQSNTLFLRVAIQALIKSAIPIVSVEFTRNEISGITEESRGGLFDVSCVDEEGNEYIIEMQLSGLEGFMRRTTYYSAYRYTSIAQKGDLKFKNVKKIYMISIIAGQMYPDSKEYHHIGCLRNQHGEFMGDEITQIVVELGKWDKQVDDIKSDLDKLIYVMKATHELNVVDKFVAPQFWSEEWIQSALKELEMSKMSPEDREYAERQIIKAIHFIETEKKQAATQKENIKLKREKEAAEREKDAVLTTAVINFLAEDKDVNDIASMFSIPVEKVLAIQEKLNEN